MSVNVRESAARHDARSCWRQFRRPETDTGRPDLIASLRGYPLFADLSPSILQAIAGLCRTSYLDSGTTLFRKGDAGDALYGIRRGRIAIELSTAAGVSTTLAFLGPGDLFGEIALLDGHGRATDAVAAAPTELFKLRRADIFDLIAREPAIGMNFIEMLCKRLRAMTAQIEEGLTQKLEDRIAARLRQLQEQSGSVLIITQDQLAQSVGATRESVNRHLRNLVAAGVLQLRRGRIILADTPALKAG